MKRCAQSDDGNATLTNAEIQSVASEILSIKLGDKSFQDAAIAIEKDFDGEDIVRVTATLHRPATDADLLFEAASDIRQRMIETGDDRFVFVRQNYPQHADEVVDEDAEDRDPS